jgi:hypothetical protein
VDRIKYLEKLQPSFHDGIKEAEKIKAEIKRKMKQEKKDKFDQFKQNSLGF